METPKEYYYTYYSYEEYGKGYIGSRKCFCLPGEDIKYLGSSSDKTFKPTHKIILKDDYTTREEAYADEITLQEYYKVVENPHFVNKSYQTSTKFYVSRENAVENGKKGGKISGQKHKENGTGVCGRSKEKMSEDGKGATERARELGVGLYGLSSKEKSEAGKIGGKKIKELGIGIFGMSPEERKKVSSKSGKEVGKQKWMCLETGFITTPGALGRYQKARGIDTSKRKRIS